jgi:hypothetical protein
MPSNGLVNQTEIVWQNRTLPGFAFPDYVLFNEWDIDPRYALWMTSESSPTVYNVPLFTVAVTLVIDTDLVQGVWSVSYSRDVFDLNSVYIQAMNCTQYATGNATECMLRYVSGFPGTPFGQLFPQNFTRLGHLAFPGTNQSDGSYTLRIQEADVDDYALYVVVQSVGSPILTTYLTRWAQDLSAFYGFANLSSYINSSATEVFFDSVYCRLYMREETTVHYLQLNCEPIFSGFDLLNSTELFLFFDLATFVADPTYPEALALLSLDIQNLGNPYLLALYRTALGEPVYQTLHFTSDGTLLSSVASVFSYPFEADEDTATTLHTAALYSSPWGQMATTDSVHLLVRTCTYDPPPCGVCQANSGVCVNSECRCATPHLLGVYPACADINECATSDGGCDVAHVCLNYYGGFECTTGGAEMTSWGTLGLVSPLSPSLSRIGDWSGMIALGVQTSALIANNAYNVSFSTQRCTTCYDDYAWGEMSIYGSPDDRDLMVNYAEPPPFGPWFIGPVTSMDYDQFFANRIYLGGYCNTTTSNLCVAHVYGPTNTPIDYLNSTASLGLTSDQSAWVVDLEEDSPGTVWVVLAVVQPFPATFGSGLDFWVLRFPSDLQYPLLATSEFNVGPLNYTGSCVDGALVQEANSIYVDPNRFRSCSTRPSLGFYNFAGDGTQVLGSAVAFLEFGGGPSLGAPQTASYYLGPPSPPNVFYGMACSYINNDPSTYVTLQNGTVNYLQRILYDGLQNGDLISNTTLSRGMPPTELYVGDHAYYRIVMDDSSNVIVASYALQKLSQLPDFATLGDVRPWIDAAMMYMFPDQDQACDTDDHGNCGTRTCVQTTSNQARCDACTQFNETETFTAWESIRTHSPTFLPTTVFSNPYVTLGSSLTAPSLWLGHRNTSVVYRIDVTNGFIHNIVQTRLPHGVAYMAQSIDTHATTIYAISPSFNWTAARLGIHNPAVVSSTLISTNASVYEQNATGLNCDSVFYPTEELYQVKGFTITNVRVVTMVLQGSTTGHQVMIKLNANLTCIAAQTITDYVGNATLHSVSFAYDYHTWYFQRNQSFPVYSGLLGGMDYVSQFWTQVLPVQPAVASLDFANRTNDTPFSILTTTSHGATAITMAYEYTSEDLFHFPVSFYQSVLLNRHNQVMGRVFLFAYSEQGEVVSTDEPTFSHWSSFGDLFTVLEPSFTLLRSPCRSRQ